MGLKIDWRTEVESVLKNENLQVDILDHGGFYLLFISSNRLILNLVPLKNDFCPNVLITLQEEYQLQQIQLVHLWEDVWVLRKAQVLSRLLSILGLNKRVHGRSTHVEKVPKEDAELFLEKYHLQGSVNARHCFGLFFQFELVALATFSNKRRMKNIGDDYNSVELIRFASKEGTTVVGGMSKLIKHYVKLYSPNDVMSYADRDWSLGSGYISAGFKLVAHTSPMKISVDQTCLKRFSSKRLSSNTIAPNSITVFNTGNLKYTLDCS